jgi:hypothetical protein
MDVKKVTGIFHLGGWSDGLKPTADPDRYTLRIWGNRSTLLWPMVVNRQARKEGEKFAAAHGYRDAIIVKRHLNWILQRYDYTIDLIK